MSIRYSFYFIAVLILLISCKNNEQTDQAVLISANESLEKSSLSLKSATNTLNLAIEERLLAPSTSEQARVWQPRSATIQTICRTLYDYIDSLKVDLKRDTTVNSTVNSKNKDIVYEIFKTANKSSVLYEKVKSYQQKIFTVDSELNYQFRNHLTPIANPFDIYNQNSSEFFNTFFENASTISALTALNSFQNNILITENQMTAFCFSKTATVRLCGYSSMPRVLIGQNTNHLKAGELLEISAGVATYSIGVNPQIIINGKSIETIEGRGTYKLKVSDKAGKHFIPVKISYKDQNGVDQTMQGEVEYFIDE